MARSAPGLVVDVGGERRGLPGRQVVCLKVVDPQANRVQRGAVDGVAGPERVERGRGRRAEAGTAVGDDDDVALVAEQLSGGHRDEQAEQREVEDDVAELAQIALLRGDFSDVVVSPRDAPPAAQPLIDRRCDGVGFTRDFGGVVFGQPAEVARGGNRGGPQAAGMLDQPRGQTAHQRDEQQHVDGGEPEAGEHVEGLQPIQPRADGRVLGDVLGDLGFVEAALRQQRAGNGGQRQQEQQHQRGAHRGQRAPGIARLCASRRKSTPTRPFLGDFASARATIRSAASRR